MSETGTAATNLGPGLRRNAAPSSSARRKTGWSASASPNGRHKTVVVETVSGTRAEKVETKAQAPVAGADARRRAPIPPPAPARCRARSVARRAWCCAPSPMTSVKPAPAVGRRRGREEKTAAGRVEAKARAEREPASGRSARRRRPQARRRGASRARSGFQAPNPRRGAPRLAGEGRRCMRPRQGWSRRAQPAACRELAGRRNETHRPAPAAPRHRRAGAGSASDAFARRRKDRRPPHRRHGHAGGDEERVVRMRPMFAATSA